MSFQYPNMAAVSGNDARFSKIQAEEHFRKFQKQSLLDKTLKVFDTLGYYVLFKSESEIWDEKRTMVKALVNAFEHPSLEVNEFQMQLHKYLKIIEAYFSFQLILKQENISLEDTELHIKAIRKWLLMHEYFYNYLIIIKEYDVPIELDIDKQMLKILNKQNYMILVKYN